MLHLRDRLATPDDGVRDHCLVGIDGNVLDRDLLLTFATVAVERLGKHGKGPGRFVGKCKVLGTDLKALLWDPSPSIELKRSAGCGDHLGSEHGFNWVLGIDPDLTSQRPERPLDHSRRDRTSGFRQRARQPYDEMLIPFVVLRAAEQPEFTLAAFGIESEPCDGGSGLLGLRCLAPRLLHWPGLQAAAAT
jgi:hypothetical protein